MRWLRLATDGEGRVESLGKGLGRAVKSGVSETGQRELFVELLDDVFQIFAEGSDISDNV